MQITNPRTPNLRDLDLDGRFNLESLLNVLKSSPLLECFGLALDPHQDQIVTTGRKSLLKVRQANFSRKEFKILGHLLLPTSDEIVIVMPFCDLSVPTNHCTQPLSALDDLPMSCQVRSISFLVRCPTSGQVCALSTCQSCSPPSIHWLWEQGTA